MQGVPGFTVARTLLEAAVDAPSDRDLRLLADGVRWRSGSLRDVAELVEAAPKHPGGQRLTHVGVLDSDAAESEPERELEVVLAPYPLRRQVELTPTIRVDFLLVDIDVVVEYQGAHHRARHKRAADGDRAVAIRALGYGYVEAWAADLRDPTSLFSRIAGQAAGMQTGRSQ